MYGITSIIVSILITIVLFILSKENSISFLNPWLYLAQISGLLGSVLISWNYLLSNRNSILERLFNGLDRVYKIHALIGKIAFVVIIHHPIFLILSMLPFNTLSLYLVPSFNNPSYLFGILAFYILILLLVLTLFVNLTYKFWKKTHEFMGLVIILASIHTLLISSDVSNFLPLRIWITGINILALFAFIYKRFIYYIVTLKNNYFITKIIEDNNYLILDLETKLKNYPRFKAGQFAFFSIENDRRDEHPFSILSQNKNKIQIGVKIFGQFTKKLSNLKRGQKINVYGPFRTFAEYLVNAKNIVFISGGIGITPFLSMVKTAKSDQRITMIHTSKSGESKIFVNLFEKSTSKIKKFKFIKHYSDKNGRLNKKILEKYISIDKDTYFFICGPRQLMKNIKAILTKEGIKQKRIIYEDFNLK